jgi:hypothetical protein
VREAVTDARGAFRIDAIPPGRYVLLARPPADGSTAARPARSAPYEAGRGDIDLVVQRVDAVRGEAAFDHLADGALGRHAQVLLMRKDAEGSAAAWEALLSRPLCDDARAEALDLYANGPLRTLGRRLDALDALERATALPGLTGARQDRIALDRATVLLELERPADARTAALGVVQSAGTRTVDPLVLAFARLRAAQGLARSGDTEAARAELSALDRDTATARGNGRDALRALIRSESRR